MSPVKFRRLLTPVKSRRKNPSPKKTPSASGAETFRLLTSGSQKTPTISGAETYRLITSGSPALTYSKAAQGFIPITSPLGKTE